MKDVMLWAGAGQIGIAIARRMGGDVQVRSCPGQGCTFTLEVRLEIVEGGPGPQSGTPCPAEEGIAAPRRGLCGGPLAGPARAGGRG